jgi:hypothetical protein
MCSQTKNAPNWPETVKMREHTNAEKKIDTLLHDCNFGVQKTTRQIIKGSHLGSAACCMWAAPA